MHSIHVTAVREYDRTRREVFADEDLTSLHVVTVGVDIFRGRRFRADYKYSKMGAELQSHNSSTSGRKCADTYRDYCAMLVYGHVLVLLRYINEPVDSDGSELQQLNNS